MPTKTKHMVRKASMSETAPLSKVIKKEPAETSEDTMAVILDTAKVTEATKKLEKIPKKLGNSSKQENLTSGQVKLQKEMR